MKRLWQRRRMVPGRNLTSPHPIPPGWRSPRPVSAAPGSAGRDQAEHRRPSTPPRTHAFWPPGRGSLLPSDPPADPPRDTAPQTLPLGGRFFRPTAPVPFGGGRPQAMSRARQPRSATRSATREVSEMMGCKGRRWPSSREHCQPKCAHRRASRSPERFGRWRCPPPHPITGETAA